MGRSSLLIVGLSLAALAPQLRAQDVAVVVETADGAVLPGTVRAGAELVLVEAGGGATKLPLRDVRYLALSTMGAAEVTALEAQVARLRDRLADDDVDVREAASAMLLAMSGAAAPFLAQLEKDQDPEVALRAQAALQALTDRGALQDGRDLVLLERRLARGWLKLERLELVTAFGAQTFERGELRSVRSATLEADELAAVLAGERLPPMVSRPPRLPLQVVVSLASGARLVGLVPADALGLVDSTGRRLCSDGLQALTRDAEVAGTFQAQRPDVPAFRAALAAKELVITSGARQWKVAVDSIEALTVGPVEGGAGGTLAQLVRALQKTGAPPAQRFWVHINDQPANPWDSEGGLGMTWSLHRVVGKAALVGADTSTNAYLGDTPVEQSLPLLCVRKRELPCPGGVEADFYHGWTGYELRLSRPVAGTELTSLDAANALIQAEFGDGWEMGEFHSPQGGWTWWGYWAEPDAVEGPR